MCEWRRGWQKAECHFCSHQCRQPPEIIRSGWTCRTCDSWNGFDAEGNYLENPHQQPDTVISRSTRKTQNSNQQSHPQSPFMDESTITLCASCQKGQEGLLRKLNSFKRTLNFDDEEEADGEPDHEYQSFKSDAEKAAALCAECAVLVQSSLSRQDRRIREEFESDTKLHQEQVAVQNSGVRCRAIRIQPVSHAPVSRVWLWMHIFSLLTCSLLTLTHFVPFPWSPLPDTDTSLVSEEASTFERVLDAVANSARSHQSMHELTRITAETLIIGWHVLSACFSTAGGRMKYSADYFEVGHSALMVDALWINAYAAIVIAELFQNIYGEHFVPTRLLDDIFLMSISLRCLLLLLSHDEAADNIQPLSKSTTRNRFTLEQWDKALSERDNKHIQHSQPEPESTSVAESAVAPAAEAAVTAPSPSRPVRRGGRVSRIPQPVPPSPAFSHVSATSATSAASPGRKKRGGKRTPKNGPAATAKQPEIDPLQLESKSPIVPIADSAMHFPAAIDFDALDQELDEDATEQLKPSDEDVSLAFEPSLLTIGGFTRSISRTQSDQLAQSVWPMHQRVRSQQSLHPSPHHANVPPADDAATTAAVPRGLREDDDHEHGYVDFAMSQVRDTFAKQSTNDKSILQPASLLFGQRKDGHLGHSPALGATQASQLISELDLGFGSPATSAATSTPSRTAAAAINPFVTTTPVSLSPLQGRASSAVNLSPVTISSIQQAAFPASPSAAFGTTRPQIPVPFTSVHASPSKATFRTPFSSPNRSLTHGFQSAVFPLQESITLAPQTLAASEQVAQIAALQPAIETESIPQTSARKFSLMTRREFLVCLSIGVLSFAIRSVASSLWLQGLQSISLCLVAIVLCIRLVRSGLLAVPIEQSACLLMLVDFALHSFIKVVRQFTSSDQLLTSDQPFLIIHFLCQQLLDSGKYVYQHSTFNAEWAAEQLSKSPELFLLLSLAIVGSARYILASSSSENPKREAMHNESSRYSSRRSGRQNHAFN